MYMMTIAPTSRRDLAEIAKSSEASGHRSIIAFVSRLEMAGLYGDATEDEIEEYDDLDEEMNG